MEGRKNEVKTKKSEIKEIDLNLHKVIKSICKISYGNKCATGFLIKLYKDEKELYCLMTNEHVIKKKMIDSKEIINVKYNYENKWIQIKLDSNKRFITHNSTLDFTIIEVRELINEKYFLFPNMNNINYINKRIYIPQFPDGLKLSVSEGKIINIKNYELIYDASTEDGSSGSPILLKDTTEVIGIHKQGNTRTREENYGTLINSINQLLQINNEEKSYENIFDGCSSLMKENVLIKNSEIK